MKNSYLNIFNVDAINGFTQPIYDLDCPEISYLKMEDGGLKVGKGARVIVPTNYSFKEIEKEFERFLKRKIAPPEEFLYCCDNILHHRIVPQLYSNSDILSVHGFHAIKNIPKKYSILCPIKQLRMLLGGVLTKYPIRDFYGLLISTPDLIFVTETKKLEKYLKDLKLT